MTTHDRDAVIAAAKEAGITYSGTTPEIFDSQDMLTSFYAIAFAAGAASRDAEVVSLTNQRDYEYVRAENAEHDKLLVKIAAKDAEIAELVAVLELLSKYIAYNGDDWVQRTALEALAKVRKP